MRIGILCRSDCGGSSHIAVETAKELAGRGHRIHLFSLHPTFWLDGNCGEIVTHTVHQESHRGSSAMAESADWPQEDRENIIRQILNVIRDEGLDILHVHYALPFALVAAGIKRRLQNGRPLLIATLHGSDVSVHGLDPSRNRLLSAALKEFDALSTVSRNHAGLAKSIFGLPAEPVVIPNFINTAVFHPHGKIDLSPKPTLIHVSNFRSVKDCPGAVRIFSLVREKTAAQLWFIGDGEERKTVEDMVSGEHWTKDLRFFGLRRNIAPIIAQADVMLMPSRVESFGLAALEAMACGVPVVAARVGGLPEVVLHEKTGFLFEPGDYAGASKALFRLLTDGDLYRTMHRASRAHACQYGIEKMILQYEMMYGKTLGQEETFE
ncbi:MAG: N-acetyl-alpha-D-glucosaminyl L-malate synthase BshA [Deltaproteobacteria bacterium]|nr:N-acetyl-alpha-D-glucosaminyl L-malate synthase BshA [Deltaproteobacteria bacterium]